MSVAIEPSPSVVRASSAPSAPSASEGIALPTSSRPPHHSAPSARFVDCVLILLLGLTIYTSRIGSLTVRGEETRRIRITCEMFDRGNFFVQTEQGATFVERPPLCNWIIALGMLVTGDDSVIPARLFSAFATIAISLLLYAYCRTFTGRIGAFAAGIGYLTMAQVTQLGGFGENEATMTLMLGAALIVWEWGYRMRWPATVTWCLAYSLAALATLTKGAQGPVYFIGGLTLYLTLMRDTRYLLSRAHLAGLGAFALIVGLWQVPYLAYVGPQLALETWTSEALKKATVNSSKQLITHLVKFPIQIFGAMLPWSLWLIPFASRRFRESLTPAQRAVAWFGISVWIVAFPTVWLACSGKARYLMPLFPTLTVMMAIAIDRAYQAADGTWLRRAWRVSLVLTALTTVATAIAAVVWIMLPISERPANFRTHLALYAMASLVCGWFLWRLRGAGDFARVRWALLLWASFLGMSHLVPYVDLMVGLASDGAGDMRKVTDRLPPDVEMVSLGSIDHVFQYHYKQPIRMVAAYGDGDFEYFCFNRWLHRDDSLNFPWEKVGELCCDRNIDMHERYVVVGRRLDVEQAKSVPATVVRR